MRYFLKKILASGLYYTGIISLTRKLFPIKEITVLMYHKVDPKNFEKQVAYIKKYYNPISEQDLHDYYYKNKELPENSVLLTFDDGYLNNYLYAWPVLKKYEVPALIFLTTGLIGKNKMAWFDEIDYVLEKTTKKEIVFDGKKYKLNKKGKTNLIKKYYYYAITLPEEEKNKIIQNLVKQTNVKLPKNLDKDNAFMNWNQIKEMLPLVSFSSHTVNHPILPNLYLERKKEELKASKIEIQKKSGKAPLSICYPNGDYDEETIKTSKELEYKLGFSSNFGRNNRKINPFTIQRIGANIQDTPKIIFAKLTKLSTAFQKTKTKPHFKVIMVTNYYYPQAGGITTVVEKLSENLKKNNIKNIILSYPQIFRKIENLFKNPKNIHKLLVGIFLAYSTIIVIFNRIFNKKLVLHSHSANFCALVSLVGKKLGCKTVHTFHTHLDMSPSIGETSPKSYLDNIDQLTAVSNFLGDSYKNKYHLKSNIRTIYNGAPEIINTKNKKIGNKIKVLFVGNLLEIKDPFLFIKSVEILSKSKNVESIIIGDGPLRNKIENYIKENNIKNIKLLGSLEKEKMIEQYKNSDVTVLTSKGEGLAVVLLESMSAGVPVVSTIAGGSVEVIENMKNGILVKERTPEAISKGILLALKNKDYLTKNAFETIQEKFNWKKIIHQYINIYSQLTYEKSYKSSEENVN